ncbi:hypothetical protein V6N12_069606 [Hibiscus sabdariffa]|uniref:Uncharacterized protein n=1 Tax=Hibiscus sabdariffa TaxID=183260 RepID=A0ABR2FEG2_9ROSI
MVEEDTSAREKVLSEVGPSTRDDPVLNVLGNTDSRAATHQPKATKNVAYMKSKDVARSDERMKPVQVSVDQDMIVISQDNADKSDRRTAVTLLEKKYENQGSTGGKIVKARGLTGRVQVKGHRRGFSLKKPAEVHSRPQPSLLDWMSTFSQQLDVAEISEKHGIDGIMNLSNLGDGHDPPIGGLATEHNGVHSPTVHADLGGGQETMEFPKLQQWVHFTSVYASPVATVRRHIWSRLESLFPDPSTLWVVGGDFDSILVSDERRGGLVELKVVACFEN